MRSSPPARLRWIHHSKRSRSLLVVDDVVMALSLPATNIVPLEISPLLGDIVTQHPLPALNDLGLLTLNLLALKH